MFHILWHCHTWLMSGLQELSRIFMSKLYWPICLCWKTFCFALWAVCLVNVLMMRSCVSWQIVITFTGSCFLWHWRTIESWLLKHATQFGVSCALWPLFFSHDISSWLVYSWHAFYLPYSCRLLVLYLRHSSGTSMLIRIQ
jgi:hypothetical protein